MDSLGNIASMLGLVVSWALIDSIDPCVFALFLSILASSMMISVRNAVKLGTAFITGIYVGYTVFGLLLRVTVVRLPIEILASMVMVYGLVVMIQVFRGSNRVDIVCREDDIPCRISNALKLEKLAKGVVPTAALGFIASFTLLPCTAGLFVTYIFVTNTYSYALWVPLTLLYVAIFVLPLVAIMLTVVGFANVSKVYENLVKHEKIFKIAGSMMMITVSIYMLIKYKSLF